MIHILLFQSEQMSCILYLYKAFHINYLDLNNVIKLFHSRALFYYSAVLCDLFRLLFIKQGVISKSHPNPLRRLYLAVFSIISSWSASLYQCYPLIHRSTVQSWKTTAKSEHVHNLILITRVANIWSRK